MNTNRTIHLIEIPIGGQGSFIWNRLHDEREGLCEALLRESAPRFEQRKPILQARLRKVDDALDRLMAGSYGNCSKCGRAIDDTTLDIDPALSVCLKCWNRASGATASSELVQDISATWH
jgi:hypothetical protein